MPVSAEAVDSLAIGFASLGTVSEEVVQGSAAEGELEEPVAVQDPSFPFTPLAAVSLALAECIVTGRQNLKQPFVLAQSRWRVVSRLGS